MLSQASWPGGSHPNPRHRMINGIRCKTWSFVFDNLLSDHASPPNRNHTSNPDPFWTYLNAYERNNTHSSPSQINSLIIGPHWWLNLNPNKYLMLKWLPKLPVIKQWDISLDRLMLTSITLCWACFTTVKPTKSSYIFIQASNLCVAVAAAAFAAEVDEKLFWFLWINKLKILCFCNVNMFTTDILI